MAEKKVDKRVNRVDVVTMGCSKNLIDSERLMKRLEKAGLTPRHNPEKVEAGTAVVNTCGFIGDAKEESIDMILSLAEAKERGDIDHLIVMGCLSERYRKDLSDEIPEVDAWFGKFDWTGVIDYISPGANASEIKSWERKLTTARHHSYVKISEGCNRKCAFCAIPIITGSHRSRQMGEILDEVKSLVDSGVKEFNVIAQDLSSYGLDLSHRQDLPELIDKMANIRGVEWIRLHYAYPAQFPVGILDVMSSRDNVCKYLDIALQHIDDKVLHNMRRRITTDETYKLIELIRHKVKDIHLRTTLMVGFPGEGEKEFENLIRFVETQQFERMGAFAYCEEDDTWAKKMFEDTIPENVKQARLDRLMEIQEKISDNIQQDKVGRIIKTIIDREESDYYVGRSQWDSPDVDTEILVQKSKILKPGEFYDVKITSAMPFDLYGVVE